MLSSHWVQDAQNQDHSNSGSGDITLAAGSVLMILQHWMN